MDSLPEHKEEEEERLRVLQAYRILDTPRESDFDDLVKLAAELCETPISLVSLVDRDRQWFKGRYGLDTTETPRQVSFCSHAIQTPEETFEVTDASKDPRFADNQLVTGGPRIRFYAGVPLVSPEGQALGTLCVIDRKPRHLTVYQKNALRTLSRQVLTQLELRRRLAELGRASRALAETNAELEGFYHAVSHDLRAPLRAVVGLAGLLRARYGGKLDQPAVEWLRQMQHHSQRTEHILDDFIKLLRVRSHPLTPVLLPMRKLVEEVVTELKATSPRARIQIDSLPDANGDQGLICQVWVNLVSNALKFSRHRDPPLVQIGFQAQPTRIVYFVKDNGAGFDAGSAEQLWTAFRRLHGKEYEGSGLGLSIVRQIVQRHGGDVWAEGKPDQGATFYFSLPKPTSGSEH